MDPAFTVKEVADLLKLKPDAVRSRLRKHKMKGKKEAGSKGWLISPEEVKKFLP